MYTKYADVNAHKLFLVQLILKAGVKIMNKNKKINLLILSILLAITPLQTNCGWLSDTATFFRNSHVSFSKEYCNPSYFLLLLIPVIPAYIAYERKIISNKISGFWSGIRKFFENHNYNYDSNSGSKSNSDDDEYFNAKDDLETDMKIEPYSINEFSFDEDTYTLGKITIKKKKRRGLHNGGNNCYINSLIQALMSIKLFRVRLEKIIQIKNERGKADDICKKLHVLLVKLNENKGSAVDCKKIHKMIKELLGLNEAEKQAQQDPSEAFMLTIDKIIEIEDELKIKEEEKVSTIFFFQQHTRFWNVTSDTDDREVEFHNLIIIRPLDHSKVQTAIDTHYQKKDYKEKGIDCYGSKSEQCILNNTPKILTIIANRTFSHGSLKDKNYQTSKITAPIKYPVDNHILFGGQSYRFCSSVIHHGENMNSGHYTAMDNTHHYNDSVVSLVAPFLAILQNGYADISEETVYQYSTPVIYFLVRDENKTEASQ